MSCDLAKECANFRKFPMCYTKGGWKTCSYNSRKGAGIEKGDRRILKTLIKAIAILIFLYFFALIVTTIFGEL